LASRSGEFLASRHSSSCPRLSLPRANDMKIIFSRKGFDKKNGGVASPIFPDEGLCSTPVPAPWDQEDPPARRYQVKYENLSYDTEILGSVVEELSLNRRQGEPRIRGTDSCHLDPDLIRGDLVRKAGWLPMFGQSNAACAHLFNRGVREGDIFLFFGWFHRLRKPTDRFRFDPERQDAHVIFGWLQIGEIWCQFKVPNRATPVLPKWAKNHPHVREAIREYYNLGKPRDAVFIATRQLNLPGLRRRLPGGGVFKEYHPKLQLTEPGEGRRVWRVPTWIYPFPNKPPLTYHGDRKRWGKDGRGTLLTTVDIGQEFVLDVDYYPRAYHWLAELFRFRTAA